MTLSRNSPVAPLDYTTGTGPWSDFGSGWTPGGYWKDPHGLVHLRGLVQAPAGNSTIAVLPPGFRPIASELFAVQAFVPTSGPAAQYVATGQTVSFGPGTGNPISVFGTVTTSPDPAGRMTAKGVYTCEATGNYLVTVSAAWTGSTGAQAGYIGGLNNTSGYAVESAYYSNSVIGTPGATGSSIIPANAGETLSPVLSNVVNATLNSTGTGTTRPVIFWSVVQVDAPAARVDVASSGTITGASQIVAPVGFLGLSGISFLAGV